MDEHETHVDNSSRKFAMPFTMLKLAYYACNVEQRKFYDTEISGVPVELKKCCNHLMAPGDRLRDVELDVCNEAASRGHLDCLQQAHVAGMPWNWRSVESACRRGHLDCLTYLHTNGCHTGLTMSLFSAAYIGKICTLEYALKNGFLFPSNLCTLIAETGNVEVFRCLRSWGVPWDETTTAKAAEYGHMELLKFMRSQNCPWNATTCIAAALNGHLECLKYAHENGCPWDYHTCQSAAKNGHINCLEYAHINGCEWNILTTEAAANSNHKDCFTYAVQNGCPWRQ